MKQQIISSSLTLKDGSNIRELPLIIRKDSRARRMVLRLSHHPLELRLTVPHRMSVEKALEFTKAQTPWIHTKLHGVAEAIALLPGSIIPFMGEMLPIIHTGMLRGLSHHTEEAIVISGPVEHAGRRIREYLRKTLHHYIAFHATKYAERIGKKLGQISLKETRSRWGSCSAGGNLSFSWRLVFAPLPVINYLIAHEVAHLKEMNHSAAFWALVATLCPDYAIHRAWLKANGASLHRYR